MIKVKNIINTRRIIYISLALFLLFSTSYSKELKVGASFAPPYYSVEENKVKGLLADLMTELISDTEYKLIWKPAPTKRLYYNLINGNIDIYLGPLQPVFENFNESVIYSSFSPITIELRSYYFGERPAITDKSELIGKKVLIISGYTYGGFINYIVAPENNITYREMDSFEQAIQVLKRRNFDYHLDYKKTGDIYLENHHEPNLKFSTLSKVDLYFMVSKKRPDAGNILAELEKIFLRNKNNK